MSAPPASRRPGQAFALAGGLVFAASLAAGLLAYVTSFGRPPGAWSLTRGTRALVRDALLFGLFVLHHSGAARPRVKAWIAARVSPAFERSVYVWCASALFVALLWWWVPVPGLAWRVDGPAAVLLVLLQVVGVALTADASRRLGVFDLAGIAQAWRRAPAPPAVLQQGGPYGLVRHPIYFAWVLMVWPTPAMTGSRLTFAVLTTLYLALAIPAEERQLRRQFGEAYGTYQRQVRWRMLPFVY